MSYFAIERDQGCFDHIILKDKDGNVAFGDYLNLTYDEMKSREDLDEFVVAMFATSNDNASNTLVTLVGDDDVFIWSVMAGIVNDDLRYVLVDWTKSEKSYRYESENDLTNS